ncbi:DEAD/DEAH box helicase [Palleronia marisminoris]|uniref:DEAD/DEAH box helicase n=1 Tax=Palleronia marisminoris TaxID=315423 RepID=UPI001C31D5DE|nr:DEAD/DEAH box helicase [Palleronia marisminoris]
MADKVRKELAVQSTLTRQQARAYVRCLQTSWQVETIAWREEESAAQLDDARRLLHAAHIFTTIEGPDSARGIDCYRRTGEILEWLARAEDAVRTIVPIELLAAGAYQLGGLPAMASGLLDQVDLENAGVQLFASFLRADLDATMRMTAAFWDDHPDLTAPGADQAVLKAMRSGDNSSGVLWALTIELVRSLGLVADSLRRGDDKRLDLGLKKLRSLNEMGDRALRHDAALVITLIARVAERYVAASIHHPMRKLAELNPDRERQLTRYARDQFARRRGILWTSQLHGIDRLLSTSSFALCTPTGSGKTLVANLAVLKELVLKEHSDGISPLALYIVPSRALAGEVEAKLSSELSRDVVVTGLYGGTDWGMTDAWLTSDKPVVLIATVEKADALLRYLGSILLSRLALLVIDEAHQVVPDMTGNGFLSFPDHSNRAIRLETLVSRILSQRPSVVRIALTAVAGGAAIPVARWVEGRTDAEPVGVNYRSTRQVAGVLQTTPGAPGRVHLDLLNGQPLELEGGGQVFLQLRYAPLPDLPAAWRNSLNHFNSLAVLWTALHLSGEDRRVLVSVAQEPEKTMRWFKEALERPDWANALTFEPSEGEERDRYEEACATCLDYCGPDSFELFLLKHGIATSHGQMPQRLRRLMVEMIDRKICPITVATATLTEGVNLPFDLIFVTSLKRRAWDPERQSQSVSPLTTSEFRNLSGRAGRPGSSRGVEGMTLVAIPTRNSATSNGQQTIQRRQRRDLDRDYRNLIARLQEEEEVRNDAESPLGSLVSGIWRMANLSLGVTPEGFWAWLEQTAPAAVSEDVGTGAITAQARVADTLDELDAILLAAIVELDRMEGADLTQSELEQRLKELWSNSFTAVARQQEAWLEAAFVRRGVGIVNQIYPDAAERERLYTYGFPPAIGLRFEAVASEIRDRIAGAEDYGDLSTKERIDVFEEIGELLASDRGFGFRVRSTDRDRDLLAQWPDLLGWWLNEPEIEYPKPEDLRARQRFVADNLEFRLGVAIGAVVARAWSEGVDSPTATPTLAEWKDTTGLPWFGFWARELLRWGTHDPFVAFCLAQGLTRTRADASDYRSAFDAWLAREAQYPTAEDRIDPRHYLAWRDSLREEQARRSKPVSLPAELTGTDGGRGRYNVVPVEREEHLAWLDPSGFELAITERSTRARRHGSRNDYELRVEEGQAVVRRMFRAGGPA